MSFDPTTPLEWFLVDAVVAATFIMMIVASFAMIRDPERFARRFWPSQSFWRRNPKHTRAFGWIVLVWVVACGVLTAWAFSAAA